MSNTNCLEPLVRVKTGDGTGEKPTSEGTCVRGLLRVFVEATAKIDSPDADDKVVDKQHPEITVFARSMASMVLIYQDRLRVHCFDTDVVEHTRIGVWKLESGELEERFVAAIRELPE